MIELQYSLQARLVILFLVLILADCSPVRRNNSAGILGSQDKLLIITADDYGAAQNINEGIQLAADYGAITSISVLSNFSESLSSLKQISESHPEISIGVHLNITTGKPLLGTDQIPTLVDDSGNFYPLEQLLPRMASISKLELKKELGEQIAIFERYNIRLDFLSDQHGILSVYSPFYKIETELAKENEIPVRSPVLACKKYPFIFRNSDMRRQGSLLVFPLMLSNPVLVTQMFSYTRLFAMERKAGLLKEAGIEYPDLLVETFWGDPTLSNLAYILDHLPPGISEVIVHVGTATRTGCYPAGLDRYYFDNRERELTVIMDDTIQQMIRYHHIRKTSYPLKVRKPHSHLPGGNT